MTIRNSDLPIILSSTLSSTRLLTRNWLTSTPLP